MNDISNLNKFDLDYISDDSSNTIGSLLLHTASNKFVHQIISFENRDINVNERLKWRTALELGDKARVEIKNRSIYYYLNELTITRETINTVKIESG